MNKNKFFIIILFFINIQSNLMSEVFISYKINNEIITNLDIKKESLYLIALNNQLKKIDNNKLKRIAEESLVKERIKKIELSKFFKFDQKNPFLDTVVKDFYLKLNLKSKNEFEEYLKNYNLTIAEIKKKIEIETLWNQLIYDQFNNQIYIDQKKLKNKITIKNQSNIETSFLLSEIIFEKKKNQSLVEIFKIISKSIKDIGFENSANTFSLSDSAKFGGNIGWIKKKNLSEKMYKEISLLKINSHTKAIQIGSNFLILKLNDIKNEKKKVNFEDELKKMITFERNRQLNKFSKIYFNKIKINIDVQKL